MLSLFISNAIAQDAAAGAAQGNPITMFLPFGLMIAIFYLLIFRPQQKQQKQRKLMLENLKVGDEVLTNGGIYGKITEIKDNVVLLSIAQNVIVKMDRAQVGAVTNLPIAAAK